MDARETLIRLTRERSKSLIRAARCIPADKLTWKAAPGNRTALDILQELATIPGGLTEVVKNRKMTWTAEDFARYQAEWAKLTDFEDLLARIQAGTERIVATITATDPSLWGQKVETPWPVEYQVVDMLGYHLWNLSYHEGQLVYIQMALGVPTPFDKA